ncbi:hypothetical protein [Desulfurispira natronophila]|uniref:Rad3-related DNA helicase n=1 Tax=Desulfurispira natronophila TaxID=682562 RepID=A0A7W8DGB6_9BACT|nr:hypothetical protein [Desulfurispira natronophila]MBB5021242.1 Rad3-related DNA helicase [Desulfurispira natronophila]
MDSVERQKIQFILRDIVNTINNMQERYQSELSRMDKKIDVLMFVLRHMARQEDVERLIHHAKTRLNENNMGESFRTSIERDFQRLEQWVNEVGNMERLYSNEEPLGEDSSGNSNDNGDK